MDETELFAYVMNHSRRDVKRHLSVLFQATILDREGELTIVGGPQQLTQASKERWAAEVRRIVRERQALAVIVSAGVLRGIYTPEGSKEFQRLVDQGMTPTIDEAVKLGFGRKANSIFGMLQTRLGTTIYCQDYEYIGGKAVFEPVVKLDTNEAATLQGLFADFFDLPSQSGKPN